MSDEDARKLFVAGLSDSITEEGLRELFVSTGATEVQANVPRDRMTGRPRGFAFVTLGTAEEAANARKVLDGSLQAGRSIAVRPFRQDGPGAREERSAGGSEGHSAGGSAGSGGAGSGGSTDERTLYIRNLPYESTREEVAELFKSLGVEDIERVHLPVGPDGRGKGFGFVTLRSAASAQTALGQTRNAMLRGRNIAANIARGREERDRERGAGVGGPPAMRGAGMDPLPPPGATTEGRRARRFDNPGPSSPPGDEEDRRGRKDKKVKKKAVEPGKDRKRRDDTPRNWASVDEWDDD